MLTLLLTDIRRICQSNRIYTTKIRRTIHQTTFQGQTTFSRSLQLRTATLPNTIFLNLLRWTSVKTKKCSSLTSTILNLQKKSMNSKSKWTSSHRLTPEPETCRRKFRNCSKRSLSWNTNNRISRANSIY